MLNYLSIARDGIHAGKFLKAPAVARGVILPLLLDLGWPIFNPAVVNDSEPKGHPVFELCPNEKNPSVVIKVKSPGQHLRGDQQLFEYAFQRGAPMAVLTDGRYWHFYLPGEQGTFEDRRIYLLDIAGADLSSIGQRLQRYLDYRAVGSGAALEAARLDYQEGYRARLIQATLLDAWTKLVEEQDDVLVDLIREKVQFLCQHKPSPEVVADFLKKQLLPASQNTPIKSVAASKGSSMLPSTRARTRTPTAKPLTAPLFQSLEGQSPTTFKFLLFGQEYSATAAGHMLVKIFTCLTERDSSFPDRYALQCRGVKRNHIARRPEDLYLTAPHLAEKHSREFAPGWWIDVNLDAGKILNRIRCACDVAGVQYGIELKLHLPPHLQALARRLGL
jgi:predicted type IV restriction endonuclease